MVGKSMGSGQLAWRWGRGDREGGRLVRTDLMQVPSEAVNAPAEVQLLETVHC
jgi:hypothetical protein